MNEAIRAAAEHLQQTTQRLSMGSTFAAVNVQRLSELAKQLDLPEELIDWYSVASPQNVEVPTPGNNAPLAPGEQLDAALLGYRTNAVTGQALTGWDASWIVIGGEAEFPLIVHTRKTGDPSVYYGAPTKGTWRLVPLSSDLPGFLLGVADYLQLYIGQFGKAILAEDDSLKADFRTAFAAALDQRTSTAGRVDAWLRDWLAIDF